MNMAENPTVEDFLAAVRGQLAGSDPALIQDALYDLDEFLRQQGMPGPWQVRHLPPFWWAVSVAD
ncbi:MAG: hypothetical protein R3190_08285, partial [Thermoanaerobaculia bacterium]|nr:hypothetical protein [Thermoanaerobaculia bacterium]